MSYKELIASKSKSAVEILTSKEKFHINLGLERIKKILALLNNPQDYYEIIHIAGTNGKGSVSKIINDVLVGNFTNSEVKIGLFTSPHIFSYCERIKINNEDISEYIFDKLTNQINSIAISNKIELTEFELITAVAFYYFYLKGVKYVVLETGLGGLLDATNVSNRVLLSVITNIDLDHTERLGNTIYDIAIQKAGIIKDNCPVVVSSDNKGYKAIEKCAIEKNSKIIPSYEIEKIKSDKKNFVVIDNTKYEFGLIGEHQIQNLALAIAAIKNLPFKVKNLRNSLKNIKWKFRLEYNKNKNLLIDCAHNPNGIEALCNYINQNYKDDDKIFIFGCLKNKDYNKMLEIITKIKANFYFYEFPYPNSLKYNELEDNYKKIFQKTDNPNEIIIKNKELKIVAGSIYMLSCIFKS